MKLLNFQPPGNQPFKKMDHKDQRRLDFSEMARTGGFELL